MHNTFIISQQLMSLAMQTSLKSCLTFKFCFTESQKMMAITHEYIKTTQVVSATIVLKHMGET